MERLRDLLLKWDEGSISAEEAEELKALLEQPGYRREMVEEFLLTGEIGEYLKEEKSVPAASARAVASRPRIIRPRSTRARRKAGIVWAAVAACLLIAAGIFLHYDRLTETKGGPINARLADVSGGVVIHREGGSIPGADGAVLYSGDRILTDKGSAAKVRYEGEESVIDIHGGTEIEFARKEGAKRITLAGGRVICRIAPPPLNEQAAILTPQAKLRILGTEFALEVDGGTGTYLQVTEGRILMTDLQTGSAVEVAGGCAASIDAKDAAPATRGTPGKIVRALDLDGDYRAVAFDGAALWMSPAGGDGTLCRIDPETGRKTGTLETGIRCTGLDWDGKMLWAVDGAKVYALDPSTGKTLKTLNAPRGADGKGAEGLTAGDGVLWASARSTLFLLDRVDGRQLGKGTANDGAQMTGVTYLRGAVWAGALEAGKYTLSRIDVATWKTSRSLAVPGTWKEGDEVGLSSAGDTGVWVVNSRERKAYLVETGEAPIRELKEKSGTPGPIALPARIDSDEFWTTRSDFVDGREVFTDSFESKESPGRGWTRFVKRGSTILKQNEKLPEEYVGIVETERGGETTSVLRFDSKGAGDLECGIYRTLPLDVTSFSAEGKMKLAGVYTIKDKLVQGSINLAGLEYPAGHKVIYLYKADLNPFFMGREIQWMPFRMETMRSRDIAGRTVVDARLFLNNALVLWSRTYAEWGKKRVKMFFTQDKGALYLDDIRVRKMVRQSGAGEGGRPRTPAVSRSRF